MPASPDTVVIVDPNASIADSQEDLWVQGAPHHAITGEYYRGLQIPEAGGSTIEVKKWSRIRLSGSVSARVWTTDEGVGVQISLARPPEAPTGTPNVYPVFTASDLDARLVGYEEALAREGLIVDLRAGQLKRIDMYCDVALMAPFVNHVAGFQGVGLRRLSPFEEVKFHRGVEDRPRKASTQRRRGGSYGVVGKEHQFVIYDKAAHLAHNAQTARRRGGIPRWMYALAQEWTQQPGEAPPRGVARIEERHKADAIADQLELATGADLVARFDTVRDRFVEKALSCITIGTGEGVSRAHPNGVRAQLGCDLDLLHAMADDENQRGRALPAFAVARLLEFLSVMPDGVEEFRELLCEGDYTNRQIDRLLKKPLRWMRVGADGTMGELFDHLANGVVTTPYVWPSWKE
jgi:hypothetical protein